MVPMNKFLLVPLMILVKMCSEVRHLSNYHIQHFRHVRNQEYQLLYVNSSIYTALIN